MSALEGKRAAFVFVTSRADNLAKFEAVVEGLSGAWGGSVLDIGCRVGQLREALGSRCTRYCGLDLRAPANVIATASTSLPFRDRSWDTVVALDLLEHLDAPQVALREACRVARRKVVVGLPNMYEVGSRIRFALGKPLSGKYGLPLDEQLDRHRWVFGATEARRFTRELTRRNGFDVVSDGYIVGPRRAAWFGRPIIRAIPNLIAPTYLALAERVER